MNGVVVQASMRLKISAWRVFVCLRCVPPGLRPVDRHFERLDTMNYGPPTTLAMTGTGLTLLGGTLWVVLGLALIAAAVACFKLVPRSDRS